MNYYVNEIDFVGNGSFKQFDEEVWDFGVHEIKTPHGNLKILDAIFVEQGPHVGVQFTVKGELTLNDFTCSQVLNAQQKSKPWHSFANLIMFGYGCMPSMQITDPWSISADTMI